MRQNAILRAPEFPPVPVRRWRIHLGAHKTATTHLQETLAAIRPGLAARGVDFIPNPTVRGQGLASELWRRRPFARLPILGRARMREVIEALVDPLRLGPDTVVLSEENIVGTPQQQIYTEVLYPQAAVNVTRLASLGLRSELTLFLSIRSFDTLLPSAYAEALKHVPPPPGGFEGLKGRLLATPPSWFELVRRISSTVPEAPLRIWRQEDYRAHARAVMEQLCGCDLGPLPEIADPSWTRSPSASAIAAAEALPRDLSWAERRARVGEIYAASGEGDHRFRPFSVAEQRQLRTAYELDLERISKAYPRALMIFESRELAA
jgi:hypothetical protein